MYSIQGVTQAQRNLSHFLLPFPPSHPTHSHSPPRWTRTPTTPGTPQERTPWTAPVSLPGQPSGPTPAATCHQGEARGDDGNCTIISYKGNPYGSLHTYIPRLWCTYVVSLICTVIAQPYSLSIARWSYVCYICLSKMVSFQEVLCKMLVCCSLTIQYSRHIPTEYTRPVYSLYIRPRL